MNKLINEILYCYRVWKLDRLNIMLNSLTDEEYVNLYEYLRLNDMNTYCKLVDMEYPK